MTIRSFPWKSVARLRTIARVNRLPVHQPPPERVIEDLMRAGVTRSTAMAMELWKAREVLELLRDTGRGDLQGGGLSPARGSI